MAKKRSRVVWFDDVARRFNVTPETLRDWIAEGRFPHPQGVGNRLFYSEAELDAIVECAFLGRWGPAPPAGQPAASEKSGKSREKPGKSGSETNLEGSQG